MLGVLCGSVVKSRARWARNEANLCMGGVGSAATTQRRAANDFIFPLLACGPANVWLRPYQSVHQLQFSTKESPRGRKPILQLHVGRV